MAQENPFTREKKLNALAITLLEQCQEERITMLELEILLRKIRYSAMKTVIKHESNAD